MNPKFTQREIEVVKAMWRHEGNRKAVKRELCVEDSTIKAHLHSMYNKAGIEGTPGRSTYKIITLMRYCLLKGIVSR